MIYNSLGERYGLRIIPGRNSFLVLPNNVSRSTAVGAILHPGGPARSPLTRNGQRAGRSDSVTSLNSSSFNSGGSADDYNNINSNSSPFTFSNGVHSSSGGIKNGGGGGAGRRSIGSSDDGFGSGAEDVDFLLAVSSDEKLLTRLNEFDSSETVSTSGKGTDGKWTLDSEEAVKVLGMFAGVV